MGWLDKAKQSKQEKHDRLMEEVNRRIAERKAQEDAAEAAIVPAFTPYLKIAEEFCAETGWEISPIWAGTSGRRAVNMSRRWQFVCRVFP
jgi:hypothetical protein